ncbi:uncharacterized protein [Eucyclogobius newberryi]|uniref:uncharacterized protein n=1 Tax=Eucyclogobius newberryi TaxID=166745 RepID=UPI003B5930FA
MSSKGELIGGVSHTQCHKCGAFCRSHAHHLSHLATVHPTLLDSAPAGRLGMAFLYQASGKLFHCNICFFTHKDFTQVWQHVLRTHCSDTDQLKDRGQGSKPELNQEKETKPELNQGKETKPELNQEKETKPELNQEKETKPELNQEKETKPELNQEKETKPELNQEKETKPELNQDLGKGERREKTSTDTEGRGDDRGEEEESKSDGKLKTEDKIKTSLKRKSPSPDGPALSPDGSSSLLGFDSGLYRCSLCDWSHKLRTIAVNHVVRKHDSPRDLYDITPPTKADQSEPTVEMAPVEEEEEVTSEMMTQELEATKILRFYSNRVECELCGWKTKIKKGTRGFALKHLERSHELSRAYECSVCGQAFFMSYQLKEHFRFSHKPGRYRCLFCSFRSDYLSGFRRHSGKCNYRDEEQDDDQPQPRPEPNHEQEDRVHRPRRRRTRLIVEEDDNEDDEDD